jgi:hypothetical protein
LYGLHAAHRDLDAEARKLLILLPQHEQYLQEYGPAYIEPRWTKQIKRSHEMIELAGRDGGEKLNVWQQQQENQIEELLRRRPWGLLHTLGLLRRLPQDRFFLGEMQEKGSMRFFDPYFANTTELAALKYAEWDTNGTVIESWSEALEFACDRPSLNDRTLAELAGLEELGVGLAYLYNMGRAVARGVEISVDSQGWVNSEPELELKQRLELYDQRNKEFSLLGSTAGTFYPSDAPGDYETKRVAAVRRIGLWQDEAREEWKYPTLGGSLPKWDKRFGYYYIDLEGAYQYLKLLENEVLAQYGMSPELIVASLMAIGRLTLYFVYPDFKPESMSRDSIVHIDRKGYVLIEDEVMDNVVFDSLALQAFQYGFPDIACDNSEGFAHSFKRLAYLDSYRREDLSLRDGMPVIRRSDNDQPVFMPPPFIYPAKSHRIIDLNAISGFVNGLFECLTLEDKPRQKVAKDLEERLGEFLDERLDYPRAFKTSKELRYQPPDGPKRSIAELDVSLRVENVLVVVDAKSIRVSQGYRRHEYGALRLRWEKFEEYVKKADEQANNLAARPKGSNYDLKSDGYTHIVTLLCSAKPEYIDSNEKRFYIRDDLPRVATPLELRDYLSAVTPQELMSLPFAKKIECI